MSSLKQVLDCEDLRMFIINYLPTSDIAVEIEEDKNDLMMLINEEYDDEVYDVDMNTLRERTILELNFAVHFNPFFRRHICDYYLDTDDNDKPLYCKRVIVDYAIMLDDIINAVVGGYFEIEYPQEPEDWNKKYYDINELNIDELEIN